MSGSFIVCSCSHPIRCAVAVQRPASAKPLRLSHTQGKVGNKTFTVSRLFVWRSECFKQTSGCFGRITIVTNGCRGAGAILIPATNWQCHSVMETSYRCQASVQMRLAQATSRLMEPNGNGRWQSRRTHTLAHTVHSMQNCQMNIANIHTEPAGMPNHRARNA